MVGHQKRCGTKARVRQEPRWQKSLEECAYSRTKEWIRNEHPVTWVSLGVRLRTLCLTNLLSYSPAECSHQAQGGKDGLRFWGSSRGAIAV
jgi:hypothetical protein